MLEPGDAHLPEPAPERIEQLVGGNMEQQAELSGPAKETPSRFYNVTTTNYVPRTWDQIAALQPSLLLIDLSPVQSSGWELLEHLHAQGITQRIPIVVTSTDPRMLERVQRDWVSNGRLC